MNSIILFFHLLNLVLNSSFQLNQNCFELKSGEFDVFENDKKIGVIYRKGNYQIEKYLNSDELNFVKIKSNSCTYLYKSYFVKDDIDTLTWEVTYTKIEDGVFNFQAKPININIKYNYFGFISKRSSKLPQEILNTFDELETNRW